ncbi:DUF1183-domain-containing protein [Dothidotthia symphoricarpi CBS 119687]|uniref:Store-operated calcium entry-associated regulatory factor n=1 Tax=Dothidotthia symphoricarpi CBS 119687 TaxID=1392245 RepID=A0A6A6AC52_9PLEO|nr:DUF1183-domain-containing protein [Dothidotthia symphoricarpi CBS 119687]KAF2128291.1 DUF1183-domain-containing protein [Dothidotthia symphoricarpi CBS 119687]
MHIANLFYSALLVASGAEALKLKPGSKVKLSNVQSLTLRKDMETSHRRVEAMPQLNCIGGSARGLYDVDIMRCKNSGSDYDEDSIQWTCSASLPEEFKLGSTDVICEGYDSPDDPYILKGSCGVEYRLILTEKGQEKYGRGKGGWRDDDDNESHGPKTMGERIAGGLFFVVFAGVALWILYNIYLGWARGPAGAGAGANRPGWGGGGGGGGWGGNEGYDEPPPPYEDQSGTDKRRSGYGTTQGWRPGVWSGALGGAAAGYAAGRMGNQGNQTGSRWGGGDGGGNQYDNGEGSSRSSSGASFSSTRHESTGFGSTSRR